MTAAAPMTITQTTTMMIVIISKPLHLLLFLNCTVVFLFGNTLVYPSPPKAQFRIGQKNDAKDQNDQKY